MCCCMRSVLCCAGAGGQVLTWQDCALQLPAAGKTSHKPLGAASRALNCSCFAAPCILLVRCCMQHAGALCCLSWVYQVIPVCSSALQYALRAPLSTSNTLSKAPTPGISRAGSANMGTPAAPTPPLPPRPPSPVPLAAQAIAAGAGAAATQLLVAGPGAAPSAPLPLSTSVAAAAAAAVAAERKNS